MPKPDRHHGNGTPPGSDPELELPQRLVEDLRAALTGKVDIPREVDARIWAAARQHALQQEQQKQQQRRRVFVRWIQATTAAAAAIAFAAWVSWPAGHLAAPGPSSPPPQLAAAPSALDGSRRVDILDAFTLAKRIETRKPVHASWDVNDDGSVDHRDVDLIAARAVSLEERTLQ